MEEKQEKTSKKITKNNATTDPRALMVQLEAKLKGKKSINTDELLISLSLLTNAYGMMTIEISEVKKLIIRKMDEYAGVLGGEISTLKEVLETSEKKLRNELERQADNQQNQVDAIMYIFGDWRKGGKGLRRRLLRWLLK